MKTAFDQIDAAPISRNQKSLIGLVITGNLAEFFDLFLIGFVVSLLVKDWNLNGTQAGIILACSGLGTVLGAILWGRLGDFLGRKTSFKWCIIMLVLFTAACLFVPTGGWLALALLRIGVGVGVGGLNITSIPYVQEFVPTRVRGLLAGLGSVFIPLGLLLGSVAHGLVGDNWQVLIGLGCVPVVLLAWLHFVPESPHYYLSRGREADARKSLAWALEKPVSELLPLSAEVDEAVIKSGFTVPDPVAVGSAVKTSSANVYRQLFSEFGRALTVVSLGSFCFILGGFAVQSWGQSLLAEVYQVSAGAVSLIFIGFSLVDLLGRLGSAFLADKLGRRWTLFSFGLLGAVGALMAGFADGNLALFIVGIALMMAFGDGAFGILNAFGAEQFPTHLRASGLGLGYGLGAIAKIVGPFLLGMLIGGVHISAAATHAVSLGFFFFAACFVLGAIVYLFAQESKNKQLVTA